MLTVPYEDVFLFSEVVSCRRQKVLLTVFGSQFSGSVRESGIAQEKSGAAKESITQTIWKHVVVRALIWPPLEVCPPMVVFDTDICDTETG